MWCKHYRSPYAAIALSAGTDHCRSASNIASRAVSALTTTIALRPFPPMRSSVTKNLRPFANARRIAAATAMCLMICLFVIVLSSDLPRPPRQSDRYRVGQYGKICPDRYGVNRRCGKVSLVRITADFPACRADRSAAPPGRWDRSVSRSSRPLGSIGQPLLPAVGIDRNTRFSADFTTYALQRSVTEHRKRAHMCAEYANARICDAYTRMCRCAWAHVRGGCTYLTQIQAQRAGTYLPATL